MNIKLDKTKQSKMQEKPIYNVVVTYRERGNYLQRLELFQAAIEAYTEALRWNPADVRSLLGRSVVRAKTTLYAEALEDATLAAKLEPNNLKALQIRAETEYMKCAFERAFYLGQQGAQNGLFPVGLAECARIAKETIRECAGQSASRVITAANVLEHNEQLIQALNYDYDAPIVNKRKSRMDILHTHQIQELTRVDAHRSRIISRFMASKYLGRMSHDKDFLVALNKDERLVSANKRGSEKLKEYAKVALTDLINRQILLRESRPLYATRAAEADARARMSTKRQANIIRTQELNTKDAERLLMNVQQIYESKDTNKCLEHIEFAMEMISRKPSSLLPQKEKYLHKLCDIVANVYLDQKRVSSTMSESDREKRAFVLLGIALSREPSHDSVLRVRPPAPHRDAKRRLNAMERALRLSAKPQERCYVLHDIARLLIDTKQSSKARFYIVKLQTEARSCGHRVWLINSMFALANYHVMQNNRPEARAALLEGVTLAKAYEWNEVAEFFETCVNISMEGELEGTEDTVEQREKEMVSLMQDKDLKSAAEMLFRRMSVIPASRRFSVLPGTKTENIKPTYTSGRRMSIYGNAPKQTKWVSHRKKTLGFQVFDI